MQPFDSSGMAPVSLSSCRELRYLKLKLHPLSPSSTDHKIISSITSVNLRTIIFTPNCQGLAHRALLCRRAWAPLDDVMCGLVEKLRTLWYDRTLELEFRFQFATLYPDLDYPAFMPRFRENGRVTILETLNGKVFRFAVRFFFTNHTTLPFLNRGSANRAT